ncbi:MAG: XisH family protein [Coleofasciculus chthonoplastes F3-SA18-01]|uniref:XisH family protein n=1 Tax=Coleofasciculus chthonoplastes TaxID=64178 RepID=UPI0032F7B304
MSAKDRFHQAVKTGLIKDGWTITHDPLSLDFDNARIQIYLGGERLLAAERSSEKIAVEVKSFLAPSTIYEFHLAVGQCFSYQIALRSQQPERQLYLAVRSSMTSFFVAPLPNKLFKKHKSGCWCMNPFKR